MFCSIQKSEDEGPFKAVECSCRKSTCILLYCPCFGEGKSCQDTCKCKNCKNPKGINLNSQQTTAPVEPGRAMKNATKKAATKAEKDAAKAAAKKANEFPSLLMLTVSPGRLGLTLAIVPEGGAKIMSIDPACTFRSQIRVGDRILTIDGKRLVTLDDARAGKESVRKFGIVKNVTVEDMKNFGKNTKEDSAITKATSASATAPIIVGKNPVTVVASTASNKVTITVPVSASTMPSPSQHNKPNNDNDIGRHTSREQINTRKQNFLFLNELNAMGSDRNAEHRREDLMTELLQYDKKNGINVSFHIYACQVSAFNASVCC